MWELVDPFIRSEFVYDKWVGVFKVMAPDGATHVVELNMDEEPTQESMEGLAADFVASLNPPVEE